MQIGHQLLPGGALGGDVDLLMEHEIFLRRQMEHILDQLLVKIAGIGTRRKNCKYKTLLIYKAGVTPADVRGQKNENYCNKIWW